MSEMVDRVAKVLVMKLNDAFTKKAIPVRELARVVIEAMREPTEAMDEAGDMPSHYMPPRSSSQVWRQMIDEALSDQPPKPDI